MERVNKILNHDLFLENLTKNQKAEAQRSFCRHDIGHFLDVARIGEILNLKEQMGISRELIYAAALLHDLGKHFQYEKGIPHELTGRQIAAEILPDCGFDQNETTVILSAIETHREEAVKDRKDLNGLLYRADKLSRACFACHAEAQCHWKGEKKNMKLTV